MINAYDSKYRELHSHQHRQIIAQDPLWIGVHQALPEIGEIVQVLINLNMDEHKEYWKKVFSTNSNIIVSASCITELGGDFPKWKSFWSDPNINCISNCITHWKPMSKAPENTGEYNGE